MKKRESVAQKSAMGFRGKIEKASKDCKTSIKKLVVVFILLAFCMPISNNVLANKDEKIKPGKRQATLILSDGSKIILGASSDTIVNSKTTGIRIIVDSTGINYISLDSLKKMPKIHKLDSVKTQKSQKK
ncbi:hypothetical protein DF185_03875 [Marinifilum breve]|uniref:Uncharacterized protein n=1 Tax=Marinifilum breve TaxID=2184082 RepID=A0A2V4A3G0_9BACT|nr:hypothetical protein [Marinifilum breve]PXY03231.1 hypothetical protein DF185_03875 [Marinifilum breve]